MSKKYYVENLSIETLAELTDEMLRFRKNTTNRKLNINLLKIIPAFTATIVLIIGVVNILPFIMNSWIGIGGPGSNAITTPATITIKGVEYSTKLEKLDLKEMELTDSDIIPLKYMENLEILWLDGNNINDITPLTGLTKLTQLNLGSNQISDISPLAELTNLYFLCLDRNQISDINALARLTSLTDLFLHINQISDISPLMGLTNLTRLALDDNNQISDISALMGLTNLADLTLINNTLLSSKQINELMEALPDISIMPPRYDMPIK